MKQERDNSKKVKKMRFEKNYMEKPKRMVTKVKNQERRSSKDRDDDDYNRFDDNFDYD